MSKSQIEKFLDAFMLKEYQGRNHIVAREHYREVFHELIPKYFTTSDKVVEPSPARSNAAPDTSAL
jgi:hypothetical protein